MELLLWGGVCFLCWKPIKYLGTLLLKSLISLGFLAFIQPFVGLGVTLGNALTLAFLGAPGFALLLLLQWYLH